MGIAPFRAVQNRLLFSAAQTQSVPTNVILLYLLCVFSFAAWNLSFLGLKLILWLVTNQ